MIFLCNGTLSELGGGCLIKWSGTIGGVQAKQAPLLVNHNNYTFKPVTLIIPANLNLKFNHAFN